MGFKEDYGISDEQEAAITAFFDTPALPAPPTLPTVHRWRCALTNRIADTTGEATPTDPPAGWVQFMWKGRSLWAHSAAAAAEVVAGKHGNAPLQRSSVDIHPAATIPVHRQWPIVAPPGMDPDVKDIIDAKLAAALPAIFILKVQY